LAKEAPASNFSIFFKKSQKEATMKKTLILIIVLTLLISCTPPPSEKVASQVMPSLYDNGKNIGWIDTTNLDKTMNLLQKWMEDHPDKIILSISSDSRSGYGRQSGWLFIYYDRKFLADKNFIPAR
jgi:hypothetical protein